MKKKIDDLDIQIIKYLQQDARSSLKQLADDLHRKTSTIYHRLSRLKSNNVILGYSIIFNPEFLNIDKMAIHKVIVKPLDIKSLDGMFLNSFASFIKSEFPEVLFIALSEDATVIYLISVHQNDSDHEKFQSSLQENPYIENVSTEFLSEIIKGQQLFEFNEDWLKIAKIKTKKIINGLAFEEKHGLDDEEEKSTMEIILDDDDDDELKF